MTNLAYFFIDTIPDRDTLTFPEKKNKRRANEFLESLHCSISDNHAGS